MQMSHRRSLLGAVLVTLCLANLAPTSRGANAAPGKPRPPATPARTQTPSTPVGPSPAPAPLRALTPTAGGFAEPFSYPVGTDWGEGSTHGRWRTEFTGFGAVGPVRDGSNTALELWPRVEPESGVGTTAALVSSTAVTTGDMSLRARARTLSQNGPTRSSPVSANAWEVAWLYWNYTRAPGRGDQGTRQATTHIRKGYYLALKPNGWELGKLDQSAFPGGQRFLATGNAATFPVGATWRDVSVEQTGSTIRVRVAGKLLTTFTDGPGSAGSPSWNPSTETVFTAGSVALYAEDARVQFDDVTLNGRAG